VRALWQQYGAKLEAHLTANGLGQFVPLPKWNPRLSIPAPFLQAKALPGVPQTPLAANPERPPPASVLSPCQYATAGAYARDAVESWHDTVHGAIGGAMTFVAYSPAAAIFWCWHAFIDDLYWDWQACAPYKGFTLQTGTPLHETDHTFEFGVALNRDVFAFKKSGTGTNSTEVHVLSAASGYQQFSLQTGTALHETDGTWELRVAPNRDIFALKKNGTGSGTTTFSFAANNGPERSGSITVAGRVIPVTQAEPPCDPPMITTQPQSTNVTTGSPATLTVATSGTAPLTYQWYVGAKGDTSNPIADATSDSITVTPPSTTRYWARITNACGSVDSAAAIVTVSPCSYDLSPVSFSFPAGGGSGTITMTAQSTCNWSASASTPWITITEGLNGSGNGQIAFTVAPHTGSEPRSGSITAAGIVVPVSQSEPVSAEAPPTPTGVNARATLPARITFSWTAVPGATSYEIERRAAGGGFVVIGSSTTNSFHDDSVSNGARSGSSCSASM
jgi:hypothetical protein